MNLIEVRLSFPNLSNTVIEHKMMFHDSKPYEKDLMWEIKSKYC
jgi:hypothetical protein